MMAFSNRTEKSGKCESRSTSPLARCWPPHGQYHELPGCDHSPADHESLCFRIGNSSMQSHAPDSSTPSPKTRSRSPRPTSTAPHILAHCSSTSRGGFRDRATRE